MPPEGPHTPSPQTTTPAWVVPFLLPTTVTASEMGFSVETVSTFPLLLKVKSASSQPKLYFPSIPLVSVMLPTNLLPSQLSSSVPALEGKDPQKLGRLLWVCTEDTMEL